MRAYLAGAHAPGQAQRLYPPSALMTWPVIQAASSVASQAMRRAGSSGLPQRPCGKRRRFASCASGGAYPVSTGPGLTLVPRREGLRQQDGGPGVDGPVRVEHSRVQAAQRAVAAAAGVVADEDVQVPERRGRGLDEPGWRAGVGQVEFGVADARAVGQRLGHPGDHRPRPARVSAPRLAAVMRGVMVQEQAGAQGGQPAGHGVPDARAAAGAGDKRHPAAQRELVPAQAAWSRFGRAGHGIQYPACPAAPAGAGGHAAGGAGGHADGAEWV